MAARGEYVILYCQKCGTMLADEALYCRVCGTKVNEARSETFSVSTDNLIGKVKELIREGNVTRVIVKDEHGKVLLEIPATVGIVGALLAPWLAALGAIAAIATKCTLIVERKEESKAG